jgi:hypothetical protein
MQILEPVRFCLPSAVLVVTAGIFKSFASRDVFWSPLAAPPSCPRTRPPIFPYFIWNVETPAFLLALFIQEPLYHDSAVAPQKTARRSERLVTLGVVRRSSAAENEALQTLAVATPRYQ